MLAHSYAFILPKTNEFIHVQLYKPKKLVRVSHFIGGALFGKTAQTRKQVAKSARGLTSSKVQRLWP